MGTTFNQTVLYTALWMGGYDFRRHLANARHSEMLAESALKDLQLQKLNEVFAHAVRNKKFSAAINSQFPFPPGTITWPDFKRLPVTTKADLFEIAAAADPPPGLSRPVIKHTSGSSGRPLTILKQRSGIAQELAATWRSYGWHGIQPGDRHIRVWGRPFDRRKRMLTKIRDWVSNCARISAFDVNEANLAQRVRTIDRFRPTFIYGYASALTEIANHVIQSGCTLRTPPVAVISTAEPLDRRSRSVIQKAFTAPCLDEYGCSEVGVIGFECRFGTLHVMADNLIVEVQDNDGTIRSEGAGQLLVTDLTNQLTPVFRYKTGDYCEIGPPDQCQCKIPFPAIGSIQGRVEDVIRLPDGSSHHPALICYLVDEVDKPFGVVNQYKVRHYAPRSFEIQVVATREFPVEQFTARARRLFSDTLGQPVSVTIRLVSEIPRERSGKYRIVVSEMQATEDESCKS